MIGQVFAVVGRIGEVGALVIEVGKGLYRMVRGERRFESARDMRAAAAAAKSATTQAQPTYGTNVPQPPTPPKARDKK